MKLKYYLCSMDVLNKEQRRKNMQAIKSRDSRIEKLLGKALWHNGFRYRKNDKTIFGKPDFVFKKQKIAIFCDGDFWHGKNWENQKRNIKSNQNFWIPKIERNMTRDRNVNSELKKQGWVVLRFWESDIKKNLPACLDQIKKIMSEKNKRKSSVKEITIEEICNGKKIKIQIYGPHSLDEDGTVMPFSDQLAIITHYLQNRNTPAANHFKKRAKGLIEDICHTRSNNADNDTSVVTESQPKYNLFKDFFSIPFPTPQNPTFTFIDLFAGIGGFRLAMQNLGGKCVYSSEWNEYAQKTYLKNFGEVPFGDITKESTKQYIPQSFDILCAGFPCQPFSIAGVSKKISLGRAHGFKDKTQGTLFFDIVKILEARRPRAFFLENVKNLVSHDNGNTFRVIKGTLEELGYSFHFKVMDGKYFVPQHRERIMMVGFDRNIYNGQENFVFPEVGEVTTQKFRDILQENVDPKYTLSDKLWNYLQEYALKHKKKGNGFGFGLTNMDGISRTLSARYYKDGAEILVPQKGNPRRLTPGECALLQGYPRNFQIPVSDNQAYKQFGNSVVVPLIQAVGAQIIQVLNR